MDRHNNASGAHIVAQQDVTSTSPCLMPSDLLEGTQSVGAGDPRQARHRQLG